MTLLMHSPLPPPPLHSFLSTPTPPFPHRPGEVVEQTQHLLQGLCAAGCIADGVGGTGQVVGQQRGHLAGQPRVLQLLHLGGCNKCQSHR